MRKLIGYVSTRDLPTMKEQDIAALDGINIAFGHIKGFGVEWKAEDSREAIARIRSINPRIKLILSIGGWSAGGFSEAARTEESRTQTARSAAALVTEYGLDGIDIDWEYPGTSIAGIASSADDKENFTLFLKALREQLDQENPNHMLTIAAGGDTYFARLTNMGEAAKYLDYVQLMTYDLQGGFQKSTGHHTALYHGSRNLVDACTDKAVQVFAAAGVPKEKLVIGAAFYSRIWSGVQNGGDGLGQEAESTGVYGPGYDTIINDYVDKNGYKRYWDDEAKAPYLFNGSNFISYDDEESLAHKIAYVKEQGLGGIMYWEYCCDGTGTLTCFMRGQMDKE